MKWIPSKDFTSGLQRVPKIPPVIPVAPYPEEEGTYKGSRYYTTATSLVIIDDFIKSYLSFLSDCKNITLLGRAREEIKALALELTKPAKDTYERAKAIHSWVYKNIDYERNPNIVMPWELIKLGVVGDCKSFAVLIASLLGVVNIPCWFKLVKINGLDTLHIYNLASLSWEVVDGVGAYIFKEVKPVSGYIIFEVDRTIDWPPRPLPSGEGLYIPEKLKKYFPVVAIGLASLGIITLALSK